MNLETIIHDFGTAPTAAPRDKYHLAGEVQGTEEEMTLRFGGKDVVLVKSAHVFGTTDTYVFGVFKPHQAETTIH